MGSHGASFLISVHLHSSYDYTCGEFTSQQHSHKFLVGRSTVIRFMLVPGPVGACAVHKLVALSVTLDICIFIHRP